MLPYIDYASGQWVLTSTTFTHGVVLACAAISAGASGVCRAQAEHLGSL